MLLALDWQFPSRAGQGAPGVWLTVLLLSPGAAVRSVIRGVENLLSGEISIVPSARSFPPRRRQAERIWTPHFPLAGRDNPYSTELLYAPHQGVNLFHESALRHAPKGSNSLG